MGPEPVWTVGPEAAAAERDRRKDEKKAKAILFLRVTRASKKIAESDYRESWVGLSNHEKRESRNRDQGFAVVGC